MVALQIGEVVSVGVPVVAQLERPTVSTVGEGADGDGDDDEEEGEEEGEGEEDGWVEDDGEGSDDDDDDDDDENDAVRTDTPFDDDSIVTSSNFKNLVRNPLCTILKDSEGDSDLSYFDTVEGGGGKKRGRGGTRHARYIVNVNYAGDAGSEALTSAVREVLSAAYGSDEHRAMEALAAAGGGAWRGSEGRLSFWRWMHFYGVLAFK